MQQHVEFGGNILYGSETDLLKAAEQIALSHHEKWDGSGYPNGLSGENIPLFARICAIADVFDALTTKRPCKEAFTVGKAMEILKQGMGTHFTPSLLTIFLDSMDEVIEIKNRYRD